MSAKVKARDTVDEQTLINEQHKPMVPPFPYFGGKRKVAHLVWERFGDVANYVEPCAGSLAVLLGRPNRPRIETVNDKDANVANVWRAIKHDPDQVAYYCDWPIFEADLHARHLWLVTTGKERSERVMTDDGYYDAKAAGYWMWGICAWVGSGWCTKDGRTVDGGVRRKRPHLSNAGRGIMRQLPHLSDGNRGIHRTGNDIYAEMQKLCKRLRYVRVTCGEWWRILKPSVLRIAGYTGVFLDPPYKSTNIDNRLYGGDTEGVAEGICKWAIANGNNPKLRIALCGYEGDYPDIPSTWTCVAWKASGGYSNFGNGSKKDNAKRERIWFSPHCLQRNYS